MRKEVIVIIALLAAGFIFVTGTRNFQMDNSRASNDSSVSFPSFSFPYLERPQPPSAALANEAWQTFQSYLEFAKTHNLAGVRSLSPQISPACSDPIREEECFALMDSVYSIAGELEPSIFKYIQGDERQAVMYTDGQTVLILYFTRAEDKTLKVLGLRFCLEDETSEEKCVETDSLSNDEDGDGWWNTVESLFYQ